jgi:hypothetical protein
MMNDIEIVPFPSSGYHPLVDFESWRVAVLRPCEDLLPENLNHLQKHLCTDEVFVLIKGKCTLYTAGSSEIPGAIVKTEMKPHEVYNVKQGVWHTHTLCEDAEVLVIENRDTVEENSPKYYITPEIHRRILKLEEES